MQQERSGSRTTLAFQTAVRQSTHPGKSWRTATNVGNHAVGFLVTVDSADDETSTTFGIALGVVSVGDDFPFRR
jgi:hypothetical protein